MSRRRSTFFNRKESVSPGTLFRHADTSLVPDYNWQSLAYGLNKWVAVAEGPVANPVMYSSADAEVWTQGVANSKRYRDVTFSEDLQMFCASGISGALMTSVDGINWTDRVSVNNGSWFGVAAGNGFLVSCGNGAIQYSTNGINWVGVGIPFGGDYRAVRYLPEVGIWVTAGNGGVVATATTPLGPWTRQIVAGGSVLTHDFIWANGVLIGADFVTSTQVGIRSSDGINYNVLTSVTNGNRFTVSYGNGIWFIGGTTFEQSVDNGSTWTRILEKLPGGGINFMPFTVNRLRYANNRFVGVSGNSPTGKRVIISP